MHVILKKNTRTSPPQNALIFFIGLYCTVFCLKVCNKVALHCTLFYFIAHFSLSVLLGCLGPAWIPSCKSALILAILLATVASVPDMTFPAQKPVECLGFAWIPSCKSTQILAILLVTVPSVPDMTFQEPYLAGCLGFAWIPSCKSAQILAILLVLL
jgi:hypothetical protein